MVLEQNSSKSAIVRRAASVAEPAAGKHSLYTVTWEKQCYHSVLRTKRGPQRNYPRTTSKEQSPFGALGQKKSKISDIIEKYQNPCQPTYPGNIAKTFRRDKAEDSYIFQCYLLRIGYNLLLKSYFVDFPQFRQSFYTMLIFGNLLFSL